MIKCLHTAKKNGKNKKFVHNDFLDVDVYITMHEIGIKSDGRHIQYSVNKIDIQKSQEYYLTLKKNKDKNNIQIRSSGGVCLSH